MLKYVLYKSQIIFFLLKGTDQAGTFMSLKMRGLLC